MEENQTKEKIKHFFLRKWNDFCEWFIDKEHPHSRLNKNVFFHDLLKLIGLILVFLIVYSNVDKLNQIILIFIKIGSLLQLILLFFILRKAWHLIKNLKYSFRGLNHGIKAIISIAIVLLLLFAFLNQDKVVNSVIESYEKVEFQKFNPINADINFSAINLKGLSKNLNTCPQIDVPINFYNYNSFDGTVGNIRGTYDGWSIKGQATCRKGTKEGENLNKYYCGGYTSILGIGSVNAYVEKTIISKEGDIGKTYKYVIWNTYDENKNFIETKCIGDPDEFDKKQAEAFYNEMLKWR
ncbi:MAG: hypothetical protein PHH54_02575 [Candidatus Nanoarchaeia archaeon]|nr:hypothetical protein [Candidatus Nanoarchaeia archaeon]MDD5740846.1 hypothetical protein [Candidatus Nanoarchaeia archaeon]